MIALLALALQLPADTVRYAVRFPDPAHHEARVEVTFPVRRRDTLEIWMARSSPGRYALHEFAKNVYDVQATDGRGRPLAVTWRDPYRWFVGGHDGTVRFSYTLFGDRADGTYSQIDPTHAHLNAPASFAFARGLERRPIRIAFTVPEGSGWRAATQLVPTADPLVFTAPDLQYFMDSPVELSDHALRSWTIAGAGGRTDTIRLAVHHQGSEAALDAYEAMARRIVAEQVAIFGEAPRFDHGTYTFLADYLPWASGDGMEHRNSTVLSAQTPAAWEPTAVIGTLAHEFFHAWNIERIRPRALEPFDFTRANASDALWFGEGFTSYYDALVRRRAGILTDAQFGEALGRFVSALQLTPGRRFFGARDMALQAPFVDAAASIDPNNRANTFLSYYTYGAALGAGLDLTLRTRFPDRSLDGFFRLVWARHGRSALRYVVPRPYTVDDLERLLGEYTGDRAFARDFFARYVSGREVVDYERLLSAAGFMLRPARPANAILGRVGLRYDSTGATVQSPVIAGEPLYAAGVATGDKLLRVAGVAVTSAEAWQSVTRGRRAGETVRVEFRRQAGGAEVSAEVPLIADPALELVPLESVGGTPSAAQLALRSAWLGSAVR